MIYELYVRELCSEAAELSKLSPQERLVRNFVREEEPTSEELSVRSNSVLLLFLQ